MGSFADRRNSSRRQIVFRRRRFHSQMKIKMEEDSHKHGKRVCVNSNSCSLLQHSSSRFTLSSPSLSLRPSHTNRCTLTFTHTVTVLSITVFFYSFFSWWQDETKPRDKRRGRRQRGFSCDGCSFLSISQNRHTVSYYQTR